MARTRVVIVGGGVSGLATAYALGKARAITLLEAQMQLGGNIQTVEQAGFTIDGGPDSWVNAKPAATKLARELGLSEELMPTEPASRRVYVARGGRLVPMPEGLALGVPTRFWPIVTTGVFSFEAKLRMALEPLIPARQADTDESIAEFFGRRLGDEAVDTLVGPMLGGIYAGDASELSMRATFPQFVAQEKKYGSLVRAMRASRKPAPEGGPPPSAFTSIRGGMQRLVEALAVRIDPTADLRIGCPVREVRRADGASAWTVVTEGGEHFSAEDVVFAGPAHIGASALEGLDRDLASALDAIRYTSTATVFFALRREDVQHPLDATGFIVPRSERHSALAGTWVSSKWAHRAPEGHALIRVFFGGAGREDVVNLSDKELVDLGAKELETLMGLVPRPIFTRIFRFRRASPQPTMGHLERVATIRKHAARWPGLHFTGSGFAIGIPDCVKMAEETAQAVLERERGDDGGA
jgi:oxygen-dependent protoporphyrinogen oxidase